MPKKMVVIIVWTTLLVSTQGCYTRHKVEVTPMEVKPIHITIDVNIRVDKALDNFFDDLDNAAAETKVPTPSGQ